MTVVSKAVQSTDASEYFGRRVGFYDGAYDAAGPDGYALRSRLEATVRLCGPGPGSALDVGMGPGRLCVALGERGWTVSGVDASPEMVEVAQGRMPDAADRLLVGRTDDLPFADGSFDLVTATGVLEYSPVPAALAEVVRVLRPGGRAVVSYPNPEAYYGIWKSRVWYRLVRVVKRLLRRPNPGLPRGAGMIRPESFEALLQVAGLASTGRAYTSFLALPAPVDALLPRLSERLGSRLERRAPGAARRLATQVVYHAELAGSEGPS